MHILVYLRPAFFKGTREALCLLPPLGKISWTSTRPPPCVPVVNVLVRHHFQPFSAIYEGLKGHIQDPGLHKKKLIK